MLERWVASVFTTYLGRYIKNLDKQGLQVSMWNGEVVLNDLELSQEALNDLDLPVIIDRGVIGRLRIEIPWKNFYTKTCKIEVRDVEIAVLPIKSTPWNESLERKKRAMRKEKQLRIFESSRKEKDSLTPKEAEEEELNEESDTFGARIARHILNSLEVSIHNLVIRYEDACTDPRRPVAWTIKFEELSAIPDPEKTPDATQKKPSTRQYRLGRLRGMCFSIDHLPVAPRLTGPSKVGNMEKWREVMVASGAVSSQLCTPQPVEVTLNISSQSASILDLTLPRTTIEAKIENFHFRLKRWQYDSINRTARYVADFTILDKFRQFKPQVSLKDNAAAWWIFAFKCVQLVGRETRSRTKISWEKLKKRNANKARYVELYKRTQSASWHRSNDKEEEDELKHLEDMLDVEAIIYFRRLAYFQLRVERVQRLEREDVAPKKETAAGLWGWLGYTNTDEVETDEETSKVWDLLSSEKLTLSQRKIFYEELGIDDDEGQQRELEGSSNAVQGDASDLSGSTPNKQTQDIPLSYVHTHIRLTIHNSLIQMCENSSAPRTATDLLSCLESNATEKRDPDKQKTLATMKATDLLTMQLAGMRSAGVSEDEIDEIFKYKTVFGLNATAAVAPSVAFASIKLTDLTCQFSQMSKSWKVVMGLKDVDLASESLSGSHYRSLLKRVVHNASNLLLFEVTESRIQPTTSTPPTQDKGVAHFAPKTTTYSVYAHLSPMDCVVDVVWLQTVCAFWGVGVYGSCADLEAGAEGEKVEEKAQFKNFEKNPLTALKMALERRADLQVSVVLEQPCLIIPSNCQEIDSVALVVMAETVVVQSDPGPSHNREARINAATLELSNGSGGVKPTFTPEDVPILCHNDFYTHYLVKSEDGRVVATTTKDFLAITAMENPREFILEHCSGSPAGPSTSRARALPLINEVNVSITAAVSLIPKIPHLPRVQLQGDIPNFTMFLNRAKVFTLERALTNVMDFAANVTGRGSTSVKRSEEEDETELSCSAFALTLGPMKRDDMVRSAEPTRHYVELDATVSHLRIYEAQRASRIAVLIDLSTRQFDIEEPHNALIVDINETESLWIQLPSSSMHERWLRTLKQIKGDGGLFQDNLPKTAVTPEAVPENATQQTWVQVDVKLGDLKFVLEDEVLGKEAHPIPTDESNDADEGFGIGLQSRGVGTEWNLMGCGVALCVTEYDSRFELFSSSLITTDCTKPDSTSLSTTSSPASPSMSFLLSQTLPNFSLMNIPTKEQNQILWTNEGEPGFSLWLLTFMKGSQYYNAQKPQEAPMQMGILCKNLGLLLSPPLVAAFEEFWDIVNIFMNMAGNTRYLTARNGAGKKMKRPPEFPRPFDFKQSLRFSFEVEGEIEVACLRENGAPFINVSGEDFFLQFFDTPYGIAMDGHLYKPSIEDQTPLGGGAVGSSAPPTSEDIGQKKKWAKFITHTNDASRLTFEYVTFANRGALKGDVTPDRPSFFYGISFTHQLKMSITACEVSYFQTFFWALLEYFGSGLCTRLAFLSWRPVFGFEEIKTRGASFVTPFDLYERTKVPEEPYLDLLKFLIEINNSVLNLPPDRDAERGVLRAAVEHLGVANTLEKTSQNDVLYRTITTMKNVKFFAPEECYDESPGSLLFRDPVLLNIITTNSMYDPHERHPATKIVIAMPRRTVMFLTENVYCCFLRWMAEGLMEPYEAYCPAYPPGPLPYKKIVESERSNTFTYEFDFKDLEVIWIKQSVPVYTLRLEMLMALRWYKNTDFENDVIIKKLALSPGVVHSGAVEGEVMHLEEGGCLDVRIKWDTPSGENPVKNQTLEYSVDKTLHLSLQPDVLIALVDSLLGNGACRAGGYRLLGYVKPDSGWPAPGEPWPPGPPQEHNIAHIFSFAAISVTIPRTATVVLSLQATYVLLPDTSSSIEAVIQDLFVQDFQGHEVVTSNPNNEAEDGKEARSDAFYVKANADDVAKGYNKVVTRVGPIAITATVSSFSAMHAWVISSEYLLLANIWAPSVQHRVDAIQTQKQGTKPKPAEDATPTPTPQVDLFWDSPKLSILCANKRDFGFIVDFGKLSVKTHTTVPEGSPLRDEYMALQFDDETEDENHRTEVLSASLTNFGVQSVFTKDFVLVPLQADICLKKRFVKGKLYNQVGAVRTEEVVAYLDFRDVRTIAAVAHDYSAALTVSTAKKEETMSSAAARKAATQMESTSQHQRAHHISTDGNHGGTVEPKEKVETMRFGMSLPLLSFVFSSGGDLMGSVSAAHEAPFADESTSPHRVDPDLMLPLPSVEEPHVDSTISFCGISCKYATFSDEQTKINAKIDKVSIVSSSVGNIVQMDGLEGALNTTENDAEDNHTHQDILVNAEGIKLLVVPQVFFGMMNFVYLPYASATMPDTFASPDVITIDDDFELHCDMVLNGGKSLHISGKHKNFIRLTGNLHELHLVGDKPLIRLDPGVTFSITGTRLYLYNRELDEYVDAGDGAYVYAPPKKNEIDKGVPPIPAWKEGDSANSVVLNKSMSCKTGFNLTVHLPESQERPARGVTLHCAGGGTYANTTSTKGETILSSENEASFALTQFSIKPKTVGVKLGSKKAPHSLNGSASIQSPPSSFSGSLRMRPGDIFEESPDSHDDVAHILEPVDKISITMLHNESTLDTTAFHFRLSSADTALLTRAMNSLNSTLSVIRNKAKLKLEQADEDIIRDAIIKAQQDTLSATTATGGKAAEVIERATMKLGVIDCLVVEDSSGFDVPLFFIQLLELEARSETCKEFRSYNLNKVLLNTDYYNLESCEWQTVFSRPIQCQTRYSVTGLHKKEASVGVSWINLLITPQLIKTLKDAQKFGAAFSDPGASVSPKKKKGKDKRAMSPDTPLDDKPIVKASTQFKMYELTNQTGYDLEVFYQADGALSLLPNRAKVDFNFGDKYGKEVMHYVPVAFPGESQQVIDVGRVGTTMVEVPKHTGKIKLFCSVELTETGRKKVFLSSSVTVINETPISVELGLSSGHLIAHSGERVSVPHSELNSSFMKVVPRDMAKGFLYTPAVLGLHYGSFHKLYKEVFVITSTPIVPEATITALRAQGADAAEMALPPNFTCFCQISTDLNIGNTSVTLFPVFSLQNLTGLSLRYQLKTRDEASSKEKKGMLKKIFGNSRKGDELETVAAGEVVTDGVVHFTQADPYSSMYLDVQITQPTGENLKRDPRKFSTPFLIRNPTKNHQGRCSNIVLSDTRGRHVHLVLEFSERMVKISCPLWIINQTTFYLEIALHNPMKLSSESSTNALSAGQSPGDGIKPGRHPFLVAPDPPDKDLVDHLYCRILGGGGDPQWSSKIDISNVGKVGSIECPERGAALPKTIALSVEFPWGNVETRSRVVRFTPRWIIMNRTLKPLYIRHEVKGAGVPGKPRPYSGFVVHPEDSHQEYEGGLSDNLIAMKLHIPSQRHKVHATEEKPKEPLFCKPFLIDKMGETDVNLKYYVTTTHNDRRTMSIMQYTAGGTQVSRESSLFDSSERSTARGDCVEEFDVVRAAIFRKGSIVYVTIDRMEKPPFIIENRTGFSMFAKQLIQQKPEEDPTAKAPTASSPLKTSLRFPPLTTKAFTWDQPERAKIMEIRVYQTDSQTEACSPLAVNLDPKSKETREETLQQRKTTDGTYVFLRVRHRQSTTKISITTDTVIDRWFVAPQIQLSHKLTLSGVSILVQQSMHNMMTEIAHLSLHDIRVIRRREHKNITYSLKIQQLQLDDQRIKSEFPVVLCNKIPRNFDPFISLTIERVIERSSAAMHVQNGRVTLQPLDCRLHDSFLYQLLNFYRTSQEKIQDSDRQVAKTYYTSATVDMESGGSAGAQDGVSTRPLYLEKFIIDTIKLNATLVRSSQDREKDFFRHMLGYLSVFVRGFDDNILIWQKIEIDKHCDRAWLVASMLKDKYYSETTGQLLRVAPGVATVRNVVTDLLKTLPSSKDDQPMQYQTPRKRVRDPLNHGDTGVLGVGRKPDGVPMVDTPRTTPRTSIALIGHAPSVVSTPVALPNFANSGSSVHSSQNTLGTSVGSPPLGSPERDVRTPPGASLSNKNVHTAVKVRSLAGSSAGGGFQPPTLLGALSPSMSTSLERGHQDPTANATPTSSTKEVHLVPLAEPAQDALSGLRTSNENYFAAKEDTVSLPFHETNSSIMTKTRHTAVLQLKKKSWERFHPSCGRTTWEEYGQACTWDEFRQHTTNQEFKKYAHLAVDHYIRANLADPAFKVERQLCRCTEVRRLKETMGPQGLLPPTFPESKEIKLNWYEFAHHSTWDEFKRKTTDEEFHRYSHFARDCLLGTTEQFRKLEMKQELVSMFQM